MNIGKNCHISDKFFPVDKEINLVDRNGNKLSVGDKVAIRGCKADYGYIGYENNTPCLYFSREDNDGEIGVKWYIDADVLSLISIVRKDEMI